LLFPCASFNVQTVPKQHMGIRVDASMVAELAELAGIMSARAAGAPVTASDAARMAIERGMAVLRADLGLSSAPAISKKGATKPARKPKT
jgi:hypothetical protein